MEFEKQKALQPLCLGRTRRQYVVTLGIDT